MNALPLYNRTRRTVDLPAKFRRERRWDLLFLHWLVRRSFLGREGIENSGSFRFADHVYRNQPEGDGIGGRLIDRILLNLPATRTMRRRYFRSKIEMFSAVKNHAAIPSTFRVLTVPCGIPRDVGDVIETVSDSDPSRSLEYYGMDLDPVVLQAATEHLAGRKIDHFRLVCGDALIADDYPQTQFDFVASTGLGEFLTDEQLETLYFNIYRILKPGGIFYTSALDREAISEWLMRPFELQAHYRSETRLQQILSGLSWQRVKLEPDESGRQTYIVAIK